MVFWMSIMFPSSFYYSNLNIRQVLHLDSESIGLKYIIPLGSDVINCVFIISCCQANGHNLVVGFLLLWTYDISLWIKFFQQKMFIQRVND